MSSFQNRVYQFLQKLEPHTQEHIKLLAMDISFDGLGCTYILEWAVETVSQKFWLVHHNYTHKINDIANI